MHATCETFGNVFGIHYNAHFSSSQQYGLQMRLDFCTFVYLRLINGHIIT